MVGRDRSIKRKQARAEALYGNDELKANPTYSQALGASDSHLVIYNQAELQARWSARRRCAISV